MRREYEVEITIHETGTVIVEAESCKDAMAKIRDGGNWDSDFDSSGLPRVGVISARVRDPLPSEPRG